MATTTPNYGWDVPTSTDYVKDGATAIETLGDDIDASLFSITTGRNVGLVHVNTTTFTGVGSTILSNVFNSSFNSYRIIATITQNSIFAANQIQLRTGSTTATTGYDRRGVFLRDAGTVAGSGTAGDSFFLIGDTGNGGTTSHVIDITNPFIASPTIATLNAAVNDSSGGRQMFLTSLYNSNSVSYESLVLSCSAGNITGTLRIYGYRNS
jgi:hypothetical protein